MGIHGMNKIKWPTMPQLKVAFGYGAAVAAINILSENVNVMMWTGLATFFVVAAVDTVFNTFHETDK